MPHNQTVEPTHEYVNLKNDVSHSWPGCRLTAKRLEVNLNWLCWAIVWMCFYVGWLESTVIHQLSNKPES